MENFRLSGKRSKITAIFFIIALTFTCAAFAQQQASVIKATARAVDIRDGDVFQKGIWNLSPEVKMDTYTVLAPLKQKKVVFYTNIDSISFAVTPGKIYDFVVLLNGKDSCHTRISAIEVQPVKMEASIRPDEFIPAEKLKTDFQFFRETLQKVHPGLYRYKSKAALDLIFDTKFALLDHAMNQFDFGEIIMTIVSGIEDGHTSTDMPRLLVKYYESNDKLFPIPLYFRAGRAYVVCDQPDGLQPGTEILEINGVGMSKILDAMYSLLPGDGKITTKKRHIINEGAFSILYRLYFGSSSSFIIRYKNVSDKIGISTVIARYAKDFPCEPRLETSSLTELKFALLENDIALLKIRSFEMSRVGGKENFQVFLDSNFKRIKSLNIKHLIVDVRDNGGGEDDIGALLYSYLTNKPFRYYQSLERIDGVINNKAHPNLQIQQPNPQNFDGDCYFLINGRSFSSTAEFCSIAKTNGRGRFIGEETGGGYYGNTSGEQLKLVLPNSGIMVIVPKIKYTLAVKKTTYNDRGVIPDYPLVPTVLEVLVNKDVQLNLAIKLSNQALKN